MFGTLTDEQIASMPRWPRKKCGLWLYMRCQKAGPITGRYMFKYSKIIEATAMRYCRIKKIEPSTDQWNDLCVAIAMRTDTGNFDQTLKSVQMTPPTEFRRECHDRIEMTPHGPRYKRGLVAYRSKDRLEERAKRLNAIRIEQAKIVMQEAVSTCGCCGKFDNRTPKIFYVDSRSLDFPRNRKMGMLEALSVLESDVIKEISYEYGEFTWPMRDNGTFTVNGVRVPESCVDSETGYKLMFGRADGNLFSPILCVSCWNKIRAIVRRANEADELRLTAEHIRRSNANGKKHNGKDSRRTGNRAGQGDGG